MSAKPSVAVVPFGNSPVERQLTESLCTEARCVAVARLLRRGHVDWEAVAAAHLTGVLVGKVTREGQTHWVDLQVKASAHVVLVRRKAPLKGMALSSANLRAVSAELLAVLQRAHGPEKPPAAEAAPPKAPEAPPPGGTEPAVAVAPVAAAPAAADAGASVPGPAPATAGTAAAEAPSAPPASPVAVGPAATDTVPPAEAPPMAAERQLPLLEVQATLAFVNRQYSYAQAATSPPLLRNSTVPLAAEAGLLLGVFPFRANTGLFAALGLEASAATTVGVNLSRDNDTSGTTFPATSLSASAQLLLWLRLGLTVRLAPLLGWQMMNFEVQKGTDGTLLSGQPPVHWRALKAGAKLDWDFGSWLTLYVELSYLYAYTAGALTSAPYFTGASPGLSFDGALGLGFRVAPPLEVRLGVVFTVYALSFGGPGPAPVTGVSDQRLGGTLGLRYTY